jgi:hypothetical protein
MRKVTIVCATLFICATSVAFQANGRSNPDAVFQAFWKEFKAAVINGDKKRVGELSKFPIGMSYGIRSIKSRSDLTRRYREVFNRQTDAAKCFSQKEPEMEQGNAKRYSVGCPDAGGNEVVVYEFELTKLGWRFVRLDNINE